MLEQNSLRRLPADSFARWLGSASKDLHNAGLAKLIVQR
jgi:hypothetical protein